MIWLGDLVPVKDKLPVTENRHGVVVARRVYQHPVTLFSVRPGVERRINEVETGKVDTSNF